MVEAKDARETKGSSLVLSACFDPWEQHNGRIGKKYKDNRRVIGAVIMTHDTSRMINISPRLCLIVKPTQLLALSSSSRPRV